MLDHLSYSQLSLFNTCPKRYWFNYINEPQSEARKWVFELGNAYHLGVETLYKKQGLAEALRAFNKTLDDFIVDQPEQFPENREEERINIEDGLKYYYENIFPSYESLVDTVEDMGEFYIHGIDIPISYRIDLSTIDNRIIDHKTVGGREPLTDYNKQLLLYSYVLYQKTGRIPSKVELHKVYKFPSKTKYNPKALPVVVHQREVDFAEVLKVVSEMKAMYNNIKQDLFPAKVQGGCFKCPHLEACNNLIIKELS